MNTNKKNQSQITKMVVYELEVFYNDRAVPYVIGIFRLSKISGKFNRDITDQESEKCRNDCIVFKGTVRINELLDHVL